jgi:hypothetical protein
MADQGFRGTATGGKHMDGFVLKIVEAIRGTGCHPDHIYFARNDPVLPGFLRPTKKWDVLVVERRRLLAAIELKSHLGPSFGNNANNRAEEAIGAAVDLAAAYREGLLGSGGPPWIGYLVLVEDCDESQSPVATRDKHFPVLPEMEDASYALRYELLCRRLVSERHYDSACVILADRRDAKRAINYTEPASDLGGRQFLASVAGHVTGALALP